MKIKRSTLFILRFDEQPQLDLGAMLRGNLAVVRDEPLVATSLLTGEATRLAEPQWKLLRAVSSAEWISKTEVLEKLESDEDIADDLLARGLLLGDGEDPEIAALREREENLVALQWDDAALLYHLSSRVSGMDAGAALKNPAPEGDPSAGAGIGFAGTGAPQAGQAHPGASAPATPKAPASAPAAVPFSGAASVISQAAAPAPMTWPPNAGQEPGPKGTEEGTEAPLTGTPAAGPFASSPPGPGFAPQPSFPFGSGPLESGPLESGPLGPGPLGQGPMPPMTGPHASVPQTPPQLSMPAAPPDVAQHVAVASALGQQLQATVAQIGRPPGHFYTPPGVRSVHDLPRPEHQGPLLDVLLKRRTVRLYEPSEPLTLAELSTILYFTYGAHGAAQLAPGLIGLRKTSPSGGAMHPIEVYPLVLRVQNAPPGLYHYSVERHALSLLKPLEAEEARRLAETFTSGQSYYATAPVLFLLTARFFRNFWKYRKAQKAYKVIQLDAGHLSQTLYLLATALGLGAFFTGAVNDLEIEEFLGIDSVEQGVVGISGCGRPRREGDLLGLETQPFTPRAGQP